MIFNVLLSRPIIFNDECIISYLIRVSELNGFKHFGHLLHCAGFSWKNIRAPAYQILTGEFDLKKYFSCLGLLYRQPNTSIIYNTFQKTIDTQYFFVKYPKVCPDCLNEHGYCNSQWVYLPIVACDKHKKILVDTNQDKTIRLSWYRGKLNRFQNGSEQIIANTNLPSSAILQFNTYFMYLLSDCGKDQITYTPPSILKDLVFHEALTVVNFLAHYRARLQGFYFRPIALENNILAQHYQDVWSMMQNWPDDFYTMLNQYIVNPMSNRGLSGINKHYRDLYEYLYKHQKNKGLEKIKREFDYYIDCYWPGLINPARIKRIDLVESSRNDISRKEAAKIIGCRPERIDNFVRSSRLSVHFFQSKQYYKRHQVEELLTFISSNWSMSEACHELQITRYKLKQLLDSNIIHVLQKPDRFNRDWIIDKEQAIGMLLNLLKKGITQQFNRRLISMNGMQKKGFNIVQLITAMQTGLVEFCICVDKVNPYSFKQFVFSADVHIQKQAK